MITLADVVAARARLGTAVDRSPFARAEAFSRLCGHEVFFKLESLQRTGSFKERGALNRLLLLNEDERRAGVVAGSAGNHAQGVAYHAARLGIPAAIVMPVGTPLVKVTSTRAFGAEVVLHGANYDEAFAHARDLAQGRGATLIHAFDDPAVMAGGGTIGLEILEDCASLATVVVPVGGGGLVSGIAVAVKETRPNVRVVGVQTARVPSMRAALSANEPVTLDPAPTLADGIAVRRAGAGTLPMVARYVDEIVTVEEEDLARAILLLLETEKTVAEGAGAAGAAALLRGAVPSKGTICVVVSGGNIDVNVLARIIDRGLVTSGRLVRFRVRLADHPGALHRLLGAVAATQANVMEIEHNRAFSRLGLDETAVDLTLETRGTSHVTEIEAALQASSYTFERLF